MTSPQARLAPLLGVIPSTRTDQQWHVNAHAERALEDYEHEKIALSSEDVDLVDDLYEEELKWALPLR